MNPQSEFFTLHVSTTMAGTQHLVNYIRRIVHQCKVYVHPAQAHMIKT